MGDVGERLRCYWSAGGVKLPAGVPARRLEEFESRHGVRLPDDLRDYFLAIDGMGPENLNPPFGWDDDLFRFFPLHQVQPATEQFHPDLFLADQSSYFAFADHSIALPTFAIRLTADVTCGNDVLAIFSDRREYQAGRVAGSFSDFVEHYLASEGSRYTLILGETCKSQISSPRADPSHPLWDRALDG
jgi:SMI1 / KNR4 family (SUKH-1)